MIGDKALIAPTGLPHCDVTAPCLCTVNNEPILADVRLVQLGKGHIEKFCGESPIALDTLDVLTIKFLVYRNEFNGPLAIQLDVLCCPNPKLGQRFSHVVTVFHYWM